MAAATCSLVASRPLAAKPVAARPAIRKSVVCQAARPQESNKVAQMAVAGLAAAFLVSGGFAVAPAPVFAADVPLKNKICARLPTAKICVRDSARPGATQANTGV
ncbi:hypothetical protein WJX72_004256 [[Myrmecia] bisecta]|uniref:Uncharacterized protein n=1 Tax=[Myrmecia] bisecta TaxID=41462 RepID=A0AAW1Q742_9CHLO